MKLSEQISYFKKTMMILAEEYNLNKIDVDHIKTSLNSFIKHTEQIHIANSRFIKFEKSYQERIEALEKQILDDRQIAEMVNELRDMTDEFHGCQCLREIIRTVVLKHIRGE